MRYRSAGDARVHPHQAVVTPGYTTLEQVLWTWSTDSTREAIALCSRRKGEVILVTSETLLLAYLLRGQVFYPSYWARFLFSLAKGAINFYSSKDVFPGMA